jgi:hypothetical protein
MKRSLLLFLYSTGNIVGCILGMLGLCAFFSGFIKAYWLFIVLGLYLCGYLITPKTPALQNNLFSGAELSARDLQMMLEALIKKISKRVSPVELTKVVAIKDNILMILPRLDEINAGDYDLHLVKQTVTDYLPQMLSAYLALPPMFARMHKMRNGKTAQEVLIEQLDILDEQMAQIVINVNSKDAEALIVQGAFLKSKFSADKAWL